MTSHDKESIERNKFARSHCPYYLSVSREGHVVKSLTGVRQGISSSSSVSTGRGLSLSRGCGRLLSRQQLLHLVHLDPTHVGQLPLLLVLLNELLNAPIS